MSSCLQVENLTKSFGQRVLFENISLSIEQGDKVALVAVNGAGKTTLLKIIIGQEDYQSGKVTFRNGVKVGFLSQSPEFKAGITVLEACFTAKDAATDAIAEYEKALLSGENIEQAITAMDATGAWDYEQQAKEILTRLNIQDFSQRVDTLSGGQIKRVALAAALISNPDLLILDEPTNHLDIEMTEWLEDYLSESKMSLLMVTHDRYFLDRVCSRIIEIDNRQLYAYKGNYSYYVEKRQERIALDNVMAEKTRNLYRRELEWIRRTPSARTGKAKYRIDAFEELSTRKRVIRPERQINLGIEASRVGTKIFEMLSLSKSFGEKIILKDFNCQFGKGEKLGIVGGNGVGKSTFIKMLLGILPPDGGVVDVGETVRFGYYSQDGLTFNPEDRVIDVVKKISEDIALSDGSRLSASQFLQQFLFSPAAQYDYVAKLSGGEKRRLYLCTILISNPNFLVLDEPTNDLDIQTLNILEEYLESYKGCLIVVSHDRYFMDKIVDHLFVMEGEGRIKDFPGNYTDYRIWKRAKLQEQEQQKIVRSQSQSSVQAPPKRVYDNRLTFKERREFEQLEIEIPQLETKKSELEALMSSGSMPVDDLMAASVEISNLIDEIDTKTMRWLELSERV